MRCRRPRSGGIVRELCLALAALAGVALGAASGTVECRVVGENGEPVAGARVRAMRVSQYELADPFAPALDAVTDPEGRLTARLAPGEYWATATKGRLTAENCRAELRSWHVEAGGTLDVCLPLRPGGRVAGTVVRKADGKPVASARVVARGCLAATPDEGGRFVLQGLARPSLGAVRVSAPGFADAVARVSCFGPGVYPLRFELSPGCTVRGRVTDEQGQPVRGAVVRGGPDAAGDWDAVRSAATDERGRFELAGFSPGRPLPTLTASHRDFATAVKRQLPAPRAGEAATVDFVLTQGGAIEGRVRDSRGRRIEGVLVRSDWGLDYRSTRTDRRGRFRLEHLAEDTYCIAVEADGYADVRRQVVPGRRTRWTWLPWVRGVPWLSVRLWPHGTVEGRVVGREGRPVAGARVVPEIRYALADGHTHGSLYRRGAAVTGADGRFELEGLPPWGARVLIYADGYVEKYLAPLKLEGENRFVIDREGVMAGQVLDARTGQPIRAFAISFGREAGGIDWRADDGVFTLRNRPVGTEEAFTIAAEGYEPLYVERLVAQPVGGKLEPAVVKLRRSGPP